MVKKFFDKKIWVVLAACLAVVMLVILSAGLGNIQLQPGRKIALGESVSLNLSFEKITEDIISIPFWKQLVFWGLVFLLVVIISALLTPEMRKRIIMFCLRFALFALAVIYLLRRFPAALPELNLGGTAASLGNDQTEAELAPSVFIPPKIPSSLLYLISLGIVLILAVIVFLISRWWLKRQWLRKASQPLESFAEIARSSLADISSGMDWEDIIINCYARMSSVVDAQRGLSRRKDLTASEFAVRLEAAGLPGEAVRRLTSLFELVRYGIRNASHTEMVEAVSCLNTVLQACEIKV